MDFDYTAAAELFIAKRSGGPRGPLGYRRFASAAEAIRFAVEELPGARMLGAFMQVGDLRFDAAYARSIIITIIRCNAPSIRRRSVT